MFGSLRARESPPWSYGRDVGRGIRILDVKVEYCYDQWSTLNKSLFMGRYRPPQPKSSPYITRAGFDQLKQEEKDIWVRRADVTMHLAAAAAEGDRSENAEYIYRKKELRELDRRIRYLQKRIPDLVVVDRTADNGQVFFGATVSLESDDGELMTVRVVGSDEIDPARKHISVDSPLARAMLKKQIDDEVTLTVNSVESVYYIMSVVYEEHDT